MLNFWFSREANLESWYRYIRFWFDLLAAALLVVDLFSIMDVDMTPEVAMLTGRDRREGWDLIRTPELSVLIADGGLDAEW